MQKVIIQKNLPVKRLCGRCLSVWGPEPHTSPPPLHTVLYTVIKYTYSHREGGRGESWTREKVRGATVHKAGSKIPTWLTVSPYTLINTFRLSLGNKVYFQNKSQKRRLVQNTKTKNLTLLHASLCIIFPGTEWTSWNDGKIHMGTVVQGQNENISFEHLICSPNLWRIAIPP